MPALFTDAVDLYLAPSGAVRLLNFAPICATTSPLLFTWEELPYTHMHTSSASSPPEQQTSGSSNGPTASPDAGVHPTQLQDSSSNSSSSGGSHDRRTPHTAATRSGLPECRLIEQPGLVQAGNVAATGMPYDMLHMQDSMDSIIAAMQRQQQGQA
jgi:hypothetical protein